MLQQYLSVGLTSDSYLSVLSFVLLFSNGLLYYPFHSIAIYGARGSLCFKRVNTSSILFYLLLISPVFSDLFNIGALLLISISTCRERLFFINLEEMAIIFLLVTAFRPLPKDGEAVVLLLMLTY